MQNTDNMQMNQQENKSTDYNTREWAENNI